MNKLLIGLNDKQQKAILTVNTPVRIIAGAGSGKTKVITHKIAYLIEELKIPAYSILAMTFTNKAAKEMKERIQTLLNNDEIKSRISTFHSWCSLVLRMDGSKIGIPKNYNIIDTYDAKKIIEKEIKILESDENSYSYNQKPAWLLNMISDWKNDFIHPEEAIEKAKTPFEKEVAILYRMYQNHLKKNNYLDFDDLQLQTYELFSNNPKIVEKYRNKYKYVLIDEFQDTNYLQFEIIKFITLNKNSITIVGDPDQTIYSWRGAKIDIILDFHKNYKNTTDIILDQNYRSTQNILNLANNVIKNNKNRIEKNIFTENEVGTKITVKECESQIDEAKYIVDTIKSLIKSGYKYNDIYIMYRTNAWSKNIENQLSNNKIPFDLIGSLKFRDRKVIKDCIAFLKFIAYSDLISTERVLGILPKVGRITIGKIINLASEHDTTVLNLFINDKFENQLLKISKHLNIAILVFRKAHTHYLDNLSIDELLKYILINIGYIGELEITNDDESLENINALYDSLKLYNSEFIESKNDESNIYNNALEGFLAEEGLGQFEDDENPKNRVTLLTIHAAKGLENKIVFLCGLNENIFPSKNAKTQYDLEEERRTFYVALTRAQEKLFISYTNGEFSFMLGGTYSRKSKFINELDKNYIEHQDSYFGLDKSKIANSYFNNTNVNIKKNENDDFKIGDTIEHIMFGDGVISDVKNDSIEIDFINKKHGKILFHKNAGGIIKK